MIGTYRLRNMQSIADSWENEGYQYFYFPTQLIMRHFHGSQGII